MATEAKQLSFIPVLDEKKMLARSVSALDEDSLKKQVRLQFHEIYELKKIVLKHQEYITQLTDFILTEE